MNSSLHVCFVSLQARGAFVQRPGQKIGGAENQVRHLATWLAGHGFRVSVIVEDAGQPDVETVGGVELHKIHQPVAEPSAISRLERQIVSGFELFRVVRRIGADVYIQRTAGVETGIVQQAAASIRRRFVFIASSDSETSGKWRHGWGVSPILFRRGIRGADRLVAQHDAQRVAFESAYGRTALVIPDVYPFPPVEISSGERVVWVGRCVSVKQPRKFLELARRLPKARLVMVTTASAEPRLIDEIGREARSITNLEFIPGVPWPKLQEIYRSGGILVNTSDYEGIPNTFFEAAAHGLAIASLSVDPNGMLSLEGAGVCARGDFDNLVELVDALVQNQEARRELVQRAQQLLRERHDIDRVGRLVAGLIEELANE